MTGADEYDLVVVGAGPAGVSGATHAAYLGKRVCLVERAPKPGGAAVNTGTIPSKTLRETALLFAGLRQRRLSGVDLRVDPGITIGDFMRRERSVIEAEWRRIADDVASHGITTIQGSARFVGSHTLEVTRYAQPPRRVTGERVLIATGAVPEPPRGYAVDGAVVVDSTSVLALQRIPASMIVVGGGAVGCEYACIFAALGVRVTLVNARARLLAHLEPDVSDALRQAMTARLGVTVHGEATVRTVAVRDRRAHVTLSDGLSLAADVVLVCTGRVGDAAALGLDVAGVRTDARGFVQVDARYRTSAPHVSAAGDAIGFPALASASVEQGRAAVTHAFDVAEARRPVGEGPYLVWTIPEIAVVGHTERALAARGAPCETGSSSFAPAARGQILGDADGFVKLVFHPEDRRLLGVTIVGEDACELVHLGMTVIGFGGTIDYFLAAPFGVPTLAEGYRRAAHDGLERLRQRRMRQPGLPSAQPGPGR